MVRAAGVSPGQPGCLFKKIERTGEKLKNFFKILSLLSKILSLLTGNHLIPLQIAPTSSSNLSQTKITRNNCGNLTGK
jgi:hypothetical protein